MTGVTMESPGRSVRMTATPGPVTMAAETTVRAQPGRERRIHATLSHAEPRSRGRRLHSAVRAHDDGGGRRDGRGGTRTGAKSCHRGPGAFTMTAARSR